VENFLLGLGVGILLVLPIAGLTTSKQYKQAIKLSEASIRQLNRILIELKRISRKLDS